MPAISATRSVGFDTVSTKIIRVSGRIAIATEGVEVPRPKPSGVGIEVPDRQRAAREQVNLRAASCGSARQVGSGEPATDDQYPLALDVGQGTEIDVGSVGQQARPASE